LQAAFLIWRQHINDNMPRRILPLEVGAMLLGFPWMQVSKKESPFLHLTSPHWNLQAVSLAEAVLVLPSLRCYHGTVRLPNCIESPMLSPFSALSPVTAAVSPQLHLCSVLGCMVLLCDSFCAILILCHSVPSVCAILPASYLIGSGSLPLHPAQPHQTATCIASRHQLCPGTSSCSGYSVMPRAPPRSLASECLPRTSSVV